MYIHRKTTLNQYFQHGAAIIDPDRCFFKNVPLTPTYFSPQQAVFEWAEIHKILTECV